MLKRTEPTLITQQIPIERTAGLQPEVAAQWDTTHALEKVGTSSVPFGQIRPEPCGPARRLRQFIEAIYGTSTTFSFLSSRVDEKFSARIAEFSGGFVGESSLTKKDF